MQDWRTGFSNIVVQNSGNMEGGTYDKRKDFKLNNESSTYI